MRKPGRAATAAARIFAAALLFAGASQAQVQRTFVNLGFELPSAAPSTCFFQVGESAVPGWTTNHPSQNGTGCAPGIAQTPGPLIEIWTSGFTSVPARFGNQFAELNAEAASRIYQNVCLANGEPIGWRFSHRGRQSATVSDVMEFRVGSTAGTNRVIRAATQNDGGIDSPTCYGTSGADGSVSTNTCNDTAATGGWHDYSGQFTWTGATGVQAIGFEAISAAGGTTIGNFLDDIQVTLRPFVELTSATVTAREGTSDALPALRVVGTVPAGGISVQLAINGGTAQRGIDYTTASGTDTISVTVPAGVYDGTNFPLPMALVDDAAIEDNETITLAITSSPTNYVLSSTQTCGGVPITATTVTIADNDIDLRAALTSSVASARAGDSIGYTLTVANNTAKPTTGDATGHDAVAPVSATPATGLTFTAWTCTATGGARCPNGTVNGTTSGNGAITGDATLPAGNGAAGGSVSYAIIAAIGPAHCTAVTQAASVATSAPFAEGTSVQAGFVSPAPGGSVDNATSREVNVACNHAPVANAGSVVAPNGSAAVALSATDADNDPLTFRITVQPQHGTLVVTGPNVRYVATQGWLGSDAFAFVANDGLLDSAPATITVDVTGVNRAPSITSAPQHYVDERATYAYDVDATDPDAGDVLAYGLPHAPAAMSIDAVTGAATWPADASIAWPNRASNSACSVGGPSTAGQGSPAGVDMLLAVDESISMSGSHAWLADIAGPLQTFLTVAGVGTGANPNLYGLIGFETAPRAVPVGGATMGSYADVPDATGQLQTSGSYEDGWRAIRFALQNYPLRANVAHNLLLVTDEPRDIADTTITYAGLLADLQAKRMLLNVVVTASFLCGDGSVALGLGQEGIGYKADGQGGYVTCANATALTRIDNTITSYVNLAIASGGAAWDITQLRLGGLVAQSFTLALFDVKTQEIIGQLPRTPQPDLTVRDLRAVNGSALIDVANRGLAAVTQPITVTLSLDSTVVASDTVSTLAPGDVTTRTLAFDPTANPQRLVARVTAPAGTTECKTDNNELAAAWVRARAADAAGLSATQGYSIVVRNIDDPPLIDTTALPASSVGLRYAPTIAAHDPDRGDALTFSLGAHPRGMRIDPSTGTLSFIAEADQIGTHNVVVIVRDLAGGQASATLPLIVDNTYVVPAFTSAAQQRAVQGTAYTYQATVVAMPGAVLTYDVILGPPGLAIDANGLVTWNVPADFAGKSRPVSLRVRDEHGGSDLQIYNVLGDVPNVAPHIVSTPFGSATIGSGFSYGPAVTDINILEKFTWRREAGPATAGVDAATGLLSWPSASMTTTKPGGIVASNPQCRAVDAAVQPFVAVDRWSTTTVFDVGQPLLGFLGDTNLDDRVDEADLAAVIAISGRDSTGSTPKLNAFDADTGELLWRYSARQPDPAIAPAMADLTGTRDTTILFVDNTRTLVALRADGAQRWVAAAPVAATTLQNNAVSVADLDHDGRAEILVGPAVYDADGNLKWRFPATDFNQSRSLALDLDGDGVQEVLFGNEARRADGSLLWRLPANGSEIVRLTHFAPASISGAATRDLIVSVQTSQTNRLMAVRGDGTLIWQLAGPSPITTDGPPLVADLASSPGPEIFLAASGQLFSSSGTLLWQLPADRWPPLSGRAAAAADIDADGLLDIVAIGPVSAVADGLSIIAGETGGILAQRIGPTPKYRAQLPVLVAPRGNGSTVIALAGVPGVSLLQPALGTWSSGIRVLHQWNSATDRISADMRVPAAVADAVPAGLQVLGAAQTAASPTVLLPELRVSAPYGAETDAAPGVIAIKADIINRGSGPSRPFAVGFYRGATAQAADLLARVELGVLQAGKTVVATTPPLAVGTLGDGEVAARLLPADDEIECDTSNNLATAPVLRIAVADHGGLEDQQTFLVSINERIVIPAFSTTAPRNAVENQLYRYASVATTPMTGDKLAYSLFTAPSGAYVHPHTGEIAWTPRWGQTGNFAFELRATSLAGTIAVQNWNVTVAASTDPNTPPRFVSTPLDVASVGYAYRYAAQAVDDEGHAVRYSLTSAPTGMRIDPATGAIAWVPPSANPSSVAVSVVAKDARGATATQSFNVHVYATPNRPPRITSTPALNAAPGTAYAYTVNAIDPDGDALTFVWSTLPDGAGGTGNALAWTPRTDQTGEHAVTVDVRDGRGGNARQSFAVFVNTAGNTQPVITSAAPNVAVVAQNYTYAVVATDADNDTLAYRLADKPSGMTINASTGAIAWTPAATQVGTHTVTLIVTDGHGGAARQTYALRVDADPAGNRAPVVTSLPPLSGKPGSAYRYDVIATDADNDALTYALEQAPAGMQIASNGRIDWIPGTLGDYPVLVKVGDGTVQTLHGWTLHVAPAAPLTMRVIATPDSVTVDESVTVQVIPKNAAGQVTASLELDGVPVALAADLTATVRSTVLGEHTLFATAGDGIETASDTATFDVRDAAGPNDPVVTLLTPGDDARVTAPTAVTGTVTDTDLASWRLLAVDRNGGAARPIASGTTAVNAALLGTFDPTLLLNGQYTLILEATDALGHRATDAVVVTVDGDMKLGHYSITFEEATVPLAGIPIQVTRTYDTRRAQDSLDFGHGWTVDANNVRVHESRRLGFGWGLYEYRNGIFANWCVQPNGDPIVTVTLPDGDVQRFKARANPECQMFVPATNVQVAFTPLDGTTSTLEQTDYSNVRLVGNQLVELDQHESPIDPGRYRLTTREGLVYTIDQALGLRQLSEPNGQTLTYSRDGVKHSSGVGIDFVRDTQGRIVRMVLPDGTAYEYRYTASGDLERVIDPLTHATRFVYAAPSHPHYLKDILDARSIRVSRNEYDTEGRLVATIDADNNRVEYTHELANRVERVKDRRGHTTTYAFDENGWVLAQTNARNETTRRTYDANGYVLTTTDPRNKVTTMTYDARGNVLTEKNPLNEITTSTYNESNQLLTQKDNANRVVATNTYDERSKTLLTTTDALNNVTTFTYDVGFGTDATGELTSMTDALGRKTIYDVNPRGWRVGDTDADGHRTGYVHDLMGRVKTETRERTDATGTHTLVTKYTYDDKGRVTRTEHPDGSVTTTAYNEIDKPSEQCDALARCTTFVYDARGQETEQHYPDGTSETKTYDANGNLATETDREGRVTKYGYDEADRLTTTLHPDATPNDDTDNPKTENVYDAAGRLTSTKNARGYSTTYGYDDAGRTTTVTDALNRTTTTAYDTTGRRLSVMDALNRKTSFVYDTAGRVTQTLLPDATVPDTDNLRVKNDYDALGRKVAETDPAGRITRFAYDKLGRLERVVLPNPATGDNPPLVNGESPGTGTLTTRYTYDEVGNKRTQTDAEQHTTTWTYDDAGRVLKRQLPVGQEETFVYDAAGRRTQFTDFRGRVTTYTYRTNTDWLATIDYATQADVTMTYTPGGQIEQVTDGNGTTAYTYDERGRLDSVTWPSGLSIAYDYDANGNRTQVTTAQQSIVYAFDELDRLKTVTPSLGGGATYTYDEVGNRKTVTHANGMKTTYAYNLRNQLSELTHTRPNNAVAQKLVYTVDDSGLRTAILESGQVSRSTGYVYDKVKRLTQENVVGAGNRNVTWTYDKVGNRKTQARSGLEPGNVTYTYDANDRLTQTVATGTNAGTTTYTYDAAGNLTQKAGPTGTESYAYNDANQLEQLTALNGEVTRYAYNHAGIRISQTNDATGVNPVTQHYLVDPNQAYAQVIEEHEQRGGGTKTLSALYTFGDDRISQYRPAAGATPAATRHYHADGLGSIRLLTNASGAETDRYSYEAFGQLDAGASQVTSDNDFRYTGEQVDLNSGFYYLRARYMDPRSGRLMAVDPWDGCLYCVKSLNKYAYAISDPVLESDPSGLITMAELNTSLAQISNLRTAAATAFRQGSFRMGGQLMKQMGRLAQDLVEKIIKDCLKITPKEAKIVGSKRTLDFLIQLANKLEIVEVKSGLSAKLAGPAMRRLVEQLKAAHKAGLNPKVVFVSAFDPQRIQEVIRFFGRNGVTMTSGDIINGGLQFAHWLGSAFYEICIEN